MTNVWALAALWLGLALIASLLSIWLRVSTALSEIVDSEDNINGFLPVLDGMMSSGLITLEKVQVLRYGDKGVA